MTLTKFICMVPKALHRKHLSERDNVKRRSHENREVLGFRRNLKTLLSLTNGEAGEVPEYTVSAWMERLLQDYEPADRYLEYG